MSAAVPVAAAPSIDLRFAQLIKQFGLTKNSFAVSLGKTASVVQHLIDGRNKPGFDLLCKVFEIYPNVSRDWLLLGQGQMLVGSTTLAPRPAMLPEAASPEPPLDPIDLSDVEPRTPRRATAGLAGNRLHPAEIAATLALATAATGPALSIEATLEPAPEQSHIVASASAAAPMAGSFTAAPAAVYLGQVPIPAVSGGGSPAGAPFQGDPAGPLPVTGPAGAPVALPLPSIDPRPVIPAVPVAPAAPFIPVASDFPATPTSSGAPVENAAPVPNVNSPAGAAAPGAMVALPFQIGPETYLTAALQAQQLQHQLALAELRNQHLLEQQQMLREMLAMARQAMV